MIEKCPYCGLIVGRDILSLPHICSPRRKLIKELKQNEMHY